MKCPDSCDTSVMLILPLEVEGPSRPGPARGGLAAPRDWRRGHRAGQRGGLAARAPARRVVISRSHGDTLALIEVQDTATGIPEHLLPRVFDPFVTTKPARHGTGLGLAVVKKIVDLHGGAIGIRNAPQGGARATLLLKLQEEKPPRTKNAP